MLVPKPSNASESPVELLNKYTFFYTGSEISLTSPGYFLNFVIKL